MGEDYTTWRVVGVDPLPEVNEDVVTISRDGAVDVGWVTSSGQWWTRCAGPVNPPELYLPIPPVPPTAQHPESTP